MGKNSNLPIRSSNQLALIMDALSIKDPQQLRAILEQSIQLDVADLWERAELARTYWILLLNSVDNSEERELSSQILTWKHLTVKDSARLSCIQTAEREQFKFACARFGVTECPILLMSDLPLMQQYLKLDGDLLIKLAKGEGKLLQFVNRLHTMVENGYSLEDIGKKLNNERFWQRLQMVYKEVKSLFSINLSAMADIG